MIKTVLIWVLIAALAGAAGVGAGVFYGQTQLRNQEKAHQAKIKEMNQRLSQAMRRVSEEKSVQTTLEDEKKEVQARLDKLQKEKESLEGQNKDLAEKAAALETRVGSSEARAAGLEKKVASLEKKVGSLETNAASLEKKHSDLAARLSRTEAERNSLHQKLRETTEEVRARDQALKNAAADWQKSQGELKRMTQKYDRCAANNARLSALADELVKRYQGKGVMDSIMEKEPLTQVKKVELEKLCQEYRYKIEDQRIKEK
ncbi:MAG: hypothetical protein HXY45_10565 [Syntrophaceae bacterium]|nr:hypothetical protein [Syntrophaceae bacterium]